MSVIYSNLEVSFDGALCCLRWAAMSYARGMMMLIAAGVAFYRGWKMLPTHSAFMAFGLGVLALALAVWHLMQAAKSQRKAGID